VGGRGSGLGKTAGGRGKKGEEGVGVGEKRAADCELEGVRNGSGGAVAEQGASGKPACAAVQLEAQHLLSATLTQRLADKVKSRGVIGGQALFDDAQAPFDHSPAVVNRQTPKGDAIVAEKALRHGAVGGTETASSSDVLPDSKQVPTIVDELHTSISSSFTSGAGSGQLSCAARQLSCAASAATTSSPVRVPEGAQACPSQAPPPHLPVTTPQGLSLSFTFTRVCVCACLCLCAHARTCVRVLVCVCVCVRACACACACACARCVYPCVCMSVGVCQCMSLCVIFCHCLCLFPCSCPIFCPCPRPCLCLHLSRFLRLCLCLSLRLCLRL